MHVPMSITDYSDSFGSLIHAQNVSPCLGIVPSNMSSNRIQALAPFDLPLVDAFYDFPLGYNGRNAGIAVSGSDVVRPIGLFPAVKGERATMQPSRKLDFELELAFFVSQPVARDRNITAKEAAAHIFGFVLLNDWSARDIQKYEMTPLGVFNSKSFSTAISPWVITLDALLGSTADPPPSNKTDISPFLICDDEDHGIFDITFTANVSRMVHTYGFEYR